VQVEQGKEEEQKLNPEDFTAEDFILPYLCKPGLGQICDYCAIKTGYSIKFCRFNDYLEHWFAIHWDGKISSDDSISPYAFPEDLERAQIELAEDYQRKLRQHYKDNLKKARVVIPKAEKYKVAQMKEVKAEDRITI
jgi:hypothetical protein